MDKRSQNAKRTFTTPRVVKHQRKDFERKQAEIREREEEAKRKTDELRERERRYSEKLRNGTPEERERERVFQQGKKRGMEDLSLISWKGDGRDLSETLSDWFKEVWSAN